MVYESPAQIVALLAVMVGVAPTEMVLTTGSDTQPTELVATTV
jgi:hypothetical protein